MSDLYKKLIQYKEKGVYPFHMPGHKGNPRFVMDNPYSFDVTEVEGTDDLHHPSGILKEAEERARDAYGASATKYLVGGSTVGILAGISACVRHGDCILMARNCHKSVYHAVYIMDLRPVYIYPPLIEEVNIVGGITKEDVQEAWRKTPNVSCVVITSPTYDGIVSDIGGIYEFLNQKKIPLIVDEAHGAHLKWHDSFPDSALKSGADIVVQSLHKTLPALTPAALLHLGSKRISVSTIQYWLSIYQTSSPSYVLMASIDQCISWLQAESEKAFCKYFKQCCLFYDRMKRLQYFYLLDLPRKDRSRVIIVTKRSDMTGHELANRLRKKYKIETEMEQIYYVTVIAGAADLEEAWIRLGDALLEIDRERKDEMQENACIPFPHAELRLRPYETGSLEGKSVKLRESSGRISKEFIYTYPPGIPHIVPGEVLSEEQLRSLLKLQKEGVPLRGLSDVTGEEIQVVRW